MTRVVIQAGGMGQRLLPYTTVLPKPLMPVAGFPILEIVIRQLVASGLYDITITLGHLGNLIQAVVEDGSKWGARVTYSQETTPLGTIGAITLVPDLDEPFLVMNGDVLTDFDYGRFLDDHAASGAELSVGAYTKLVAISLGVIDVGSGDRVQGFREKPVLAYPCSMGIYAFDPSLIASIPPNTFYGFDDLMNDCLENGVHVRAHRHDGLWLDIGRHEDYELATELFINHRSRILPEQFAEVGSPI